MKNKINLHNHTNLSDGDYSPYELINLAQKAGIKVLAITDHDIIEAHLIKDLQEYAEKKDIKLIKGIEISTVDDEKKKYHIVGLFVDVEDKNFQNKLLELKKSRIDYVKLCSELIKKDGYFFDLENILKEEVVTKAHIADYVILNKQNYDKLINDFGKIPTIGQFIETFMLKSQKFFVPKKNIHPKDAIELIKKAKGVAILAHPSLYVVKGESIEKVTKKFLDWGVDGIEVYNIDYEIKNNGEKKEVDLRKEFKKVCEENNLLMSGGSDFHTDKTERFGVTISLDDVRVSVPEEEFMKMEQKALKRWNNKK